MLFHEYQNQPNPSKPSAFGILPEKGNIIQNALLPSIPFRPQMAAERVGQFIIILVDHKYVFHPLETLAKCVQQPSPLILVMFTSVYMSEKMSIFGNYLKYLVSKRTAAGSTSDNH